MTAIPKRFKRLVRRVLHGLPPPEAPPVRQLSDTFLTWLRFANAGMLEGGNAWAIDHALARLPSQAPLVEIGSFCGLSTNVIAYLKLKQGVPNPLICCDAWHFEGGEDGGRLGDHPRITHADYREFVKQTFMRNVSFFSGHDLPYPVEVLSDEFFRLWQEGAAVRDVFGRERRLGGPIAFAYIDGNHTYEFARRDFENVDRWLEPGGFVLFDDSADGSGWEVCRVVAEVAASGRYRLAARNPNYLFQKR